jgi:hypothetical protein
MIKFGMLIMVAQTDTSSNPGISAKSNKDDPIYEFNFNYSDLMEQSADQ